MISIGMLVKVPRGIRTCVDRPPGPLWIHHGKGSRQWSQWDRARRRTESETIGVVVDLYDLKYGDHLQYQWASVLVDDRPVHMCADEIKEFTKPSVICPHCHKSGTGQSQMERWHFDRCKWKR